MSTCELCGSQKPTHSVLIEGVEVNACYGCKPQTRKPQRFSRKSTSHAQREQVSYRLVADFSQLLRRAREQKGMDQTAFAQFLQEKESVVAKWEQGSLQPRIGVARQLSKRLNINFLEVEKDQDPVSFKSKGAQGFTLGDFIKVRKRK